MINSEGVKIEKKTIIIIGAVSAAGIIAWNVLGSVSDSGAGADQVRADLQSIRDQQSKTDNRLKTIEAGLDRGAAEAGRISKGLGETAGAVKTVETRIDNSQDKLRSSSELIAEGKSILKGVRERGQIGD